MMTQADGKTLTSPFSNEVDRRLKERFDCLIVSLFVPKRVRDRRSGVKRELLEAMIRAFDALPHQIQSGIVSANPETRESTLAILRESL